MNEKTPIEVKPKETYYKSKKGFDFKSKPLNQNSEMDYVYWNKRVFMVGEKNKDTCCLYVVKDNNPVYAFTVKYKNLSLFRVETTK
ncbi:MAG: hypothetical protein HC905_28565 [Bacteroidales bacterium]|nr:hypothetical protein [Bacteroidales bacterium]